MLPWTSWMIQGEIAPHISIQYAFGTQTGQESSVSGVSAVPVWAANRALEMCFSGITFCPLLLCGWPSENTLSFSPPQPPRALDLTETWQRQILCDQTMFCAQAGAGREPSARQVAKTGRVPQGLAVLPLCMVKTMGLASAAAGLIDLECEGDTGVLKYSVLSPQGPWQVCRPLAPFCS